MKNCTTMNDIFSISRFWLLLKKDVTENYKVFIIGGLAMLLAMASLMILTSPVYALPEVGAMFATFLFLYGYYFGGGIAASLMFAQMRTKQGKVSLFTLPATTAEKYAEQVFVYIIGFAVLYFGSIEIGELVRCQVAPLLWGDMDGTFDTGKYINHFALSNFNFDSYSNGELAAVGSKFCWFMFFSFLFELGYFSLGAVLWPKYSYIKAYAVNWAIMMAVMIFALPVFLLSDMPSKVWSTIWISTTTITIYAVLAVAAFVASYWFLKHKDVIR